MRYKWTTPLRRPLPAILALFAAATSVSWSQTPLAAKGKARIDTKYAVTPLQFEQNMGQVGGDARFLSLHGDYQVAITPGEVLLGLNARTDAAKTAPRTAKAKSHTRIAAAPDRPMRMKLVGANPRPEVTGEAELPGKINYFIGNNPKKWHTGVPTFSRVRLKQVYSGVDLVYYGNQKQLEYDFIVRPGADASKVRLNFEGAKHIRVDEAGNLRLGMGTGEVRWQRPVAYQNINGKRTPVPARYDVKIQPSGDARVGFALANYDHARPLVIDPVLVVHYFNTLIGNASGVRASNLGAGTVVDSNGNSYSVGTVAYNTNQGNNTTLTYYSGGTTTLNGANPSGTPTNQNISQNLNDMYVIKLDSTGALKYLSIIGGNGNDQGSGVALDGANNVYICGAAASTNMPVPNGYQMALGTNTANRSNGYVAKLNDLGVVQYGSYFGWQTTSSINAISVDAAGTNIYLAGSTGIGMQGESSVRNFNNQPFPPLTNGYNTYDQYFQDASNGATVGLVARLQGSGATYKTLVYATIFEGDNDTSCEGIAADPQNPGTAYVIGNSSSSDVFVSHSTAPYMDGPGGPPARTYTTTLPNGGGFGSKTLLLRVDTNQSGNASLVFGTYFGGSIEYNNTNGGRNSNAFGMAFLGSGIVWVAGTSNTTNFPTKNAAQSAYGGGAAGSNNVVSSNATLFEMDTTINGTNSLLYSTYLGGSTSTPAIINSGGLIDSGGLGVDLDASGNAYIVGYTTTTNFPTRNPVAGGGQNSGGPSEQDAFVAKIDPTQVGNATLIYSTYLGTTRDDAATGVGVVGNNVYVTGTQQGSGNVVSRAFFAKLGINTPPVANNQTVTTGQSTGINITLTASDADNDSLTYTVTTNPTHGSLTGTAPNLTYQPNAGFFGTDTFQFKANDGYEDSNIATVTINVIGRPTANNQSVSVAHNTAKAITLTGSDPNSPPRSLTYAIATNPTNGTLSGFNAATGSVTYTPTAGYHGSDTFTFTVNNGVLTSSAATVTLTVAVGTPTANGQSVSVAHNTAKAITLTGSDADVPALTLTYAIASNPTHGTLSGFNASTGSVTYTPTTGYHGTDSFTFTVSNGTNTSSPATVTLNVAAGTPTANPQSVTTNQDTAKAITLTGSDDDVPALTLTYAIASNPTHGTLSGFNAATGSVTYTPTAGYFGPDSFTFTVSNGTNTSSAATVSITVTQVVMAPVANNQSVTTNQDTAVGITLTASDPNTPARSLTYSVVSGPTHGTLSGTAPNLTYTPTAGYFGSDSFTFKANNGVKDSNVATVSITVTQVVLAPTANNQSVTTNQDTAVGITLTGSDPNNPARSLTYSVVSNPAHGTLTGTAPNLTYTPTAGYFGPDSFTFKANNGVKDSNTATVSITVTQVVQAPVANPQSVTTNQDTAVGITLTGSDPNMPPRSLTYSVVSSPTHGTLSGTAPNLTYTPTAGYFGPDSFTFKVNNGVKDSNVATVSITVTQVVLAPTANPQSVTTNQDTAVGITLTGSDPNTPPRSLTYTIVSNPTNGTLSGTAPNVTYTPNAGYFGSDSFTFKVNNGVKDSNTATVSITVNPVIPVGPTDVSGIVTVTRGSFVYDRPSRTYTQTVTLTNTSATAINGPISLILGNLTNGTLQNATGTTSAVLPAGRPYINLPAGSLAASGNPGSSATLTLRFASTGAGAISYTTQVVAGSGSR